MNTPSPATTFASARVSHLLSEAEIPAFISSNSKMDSATSGKRYTSLGVPTLMLEAVVITKPGKTSPGLGVTLIQPGNTTTGSWGENSLDAANARELGREFPRCGKCSGACPRHALTPL